MTSNNVIIYDLTKRILSDCKDKSIDIRLFGSVALLFLDSSKIEFINENRGDIGDIDIIVRPEHIVKLENYFESQGYEANRRIKMLYGNQRRSFYAENNISIDVFIGNITLCQNISILDRFDLDYPTITSADLFLTKIQKVSLSDKDIFDINYILEYINDFQYIIELSSKNWNWWKTLTTNISILLKKDLGENSRNLLTKLLDDINSTNKTINWKLRNIIGEKKQWYNIVE